MKRYALDTNTISYLLKENPTVSARFDAESENGSSLIIPLMAYYEVKRGLLAINSSKKIRLLERFCDILGVGDMSFDVINKAAHIYDDLRRIGRLADDADILIAAFCIVNDCILVTNNIRHFEPVNDLRFENWAE
jgi:tRNA(fMet)-specific endonuclease VapC